MSKRRKPRKTPAGKQHGYPLYDFMLPFEVYNDWIEVPRVFGDMITHPATHDETVLPEDRDFLNTVIKLGPRYHGRVPMAAVYLDGQIALGRVFLAVIGGDDEHYCREVTLEEFAARMPPEMGITPDEIPMSLHRLHAQGWLVMDDKHVMHVTIPPKSGKGIWLIDGHQ
ncbi:MAG TPA: hypothetical protein VHN16_01935, partial [Streptosporangiaceae bacterium]|nr:hypothetical protein [Streptosporangiaceae bacterium]